MPDHDDSTGDGTTAGGQLEPHSEPPLPPPGASPVQGQTTSQVLLVAAGFASLGALLSFLMACVGDASALLVDVGILLSVLAIILDAVSGQTLGGQIKSKSEPPIPPPSLSSVTTATILTALGLLAVMLECVIEQQHGAITYGGLFLLLLAAVMDFIAAYNVSGGTPARR